MGSALYIVAEREIAGFDPFVNGKALAGSERKLDRIAASLGVTPLMEFFSQNVDDAIAFMEDEGTDVDDLEMPEESWFDANDGLKTVQALTQHIQEHPNAVPNADEVINELEEFRAVLSRLSQEDVPWHLAVDF